MSTWLLAEPWRLVGVALIGYALLVGIIGPLLGRVLKRG